MDAVLGSWDSPDVLRELPGISPDRGNSPGLGNSPGAALAALGGLSPSGSIALGIVVGVLSTSVQSLGLTLQRKSHILEDGKAPHVARRPPHRRRRWQLGMAMFLAANLFGSTIQISTLPLPVLSTLQASGLVFNSICATLILGEPFTRWSLWGTLLVCSGAVLIAIFGAIPAPAHNLDELLELLARPAFVAWMTLQAVVVVLVAVTVELVARVLSFRSSSSSSSSSSTSSSSSSPSAPSSPSLPPPPFRLARGLVYGCISGTLSAHSLLVAKSAVELVLRTIADGNNQFRHWQAWALILVFVALALTQLYYLHCGLRLVSTSVLYPLVFCVYNIIAILDGLIYFRQTDMIGPLRACLISLGTAILLSGVLALSWRLSDEQHPPSRVLAETEGLDGEGGVEGRGEGNNYKYDSDGDGGISKKDDDDNNNSTNNTNGNPFDEHPPLPSRARENTECQSLLSQKFVSSYQTFSEVIDTMPSSSLAAAAAASSSATAVSASSPLLYSPSAKGRWNYERAEIWDELEDQDNSHVLQRPRDLSSGYHQHRRRRRDHFRHGSTDDLFVHKRQRSSTLPISMVDDTVDIDDNTETDITSPLLSQLSPFSAARRGLLRNGLFAALSGSRSASASSAAGIPASANANANVQDDDLEAQNTPRKAAPSFRRRQRRRTTTGFSAGGLSSRRPSHLNNRKASFNTAGANTSNNSGNNRNSLQETLGGIWNMGGWWGGGAADGNSNDNGSSSKGKQLATSRQQQTTALPRTQPSRPPPPLPRDTGTVTVNEGHRPVT